MQPWMQTALCQARSSAAVMALAFGQGMAVGWSSPVLTKFANKETPFSITPNEQSWIVSLFDLGIMVGAWISTLVFTRAGRRQTIMVGPSAMLVWILLTFFATSPAYLMAARVLGGAGQGIVMSFCYMYIGEVASAHLRGILILAMTMLLPLGQLVAYVYGPYVSYQWQAIAPLPVVVLTYLFIFFWMEETPFYLAMKGQHEEMMQVLHRTRRGLSDADIKIEAESIRAAVERQQSEIQSWRQVFAPPGVQYGSFLVLNISGSFALVGVSTVLAYTTQIFEASGAPIDKNVSSMLVLGIKTCMVVVAMFAIERLGRRLQLTLASIGNAIAMGGMCIFMVVKQQYGQDTTSISWIPLVLMILYISSTGIGVNTVPQVLMSEILSQRVKAILAPIIMTIVSITSFFCNKYFVALGQSPGFFVPFAFFAATNLYIAMFTLLLVPETKGKTLVEVQEMLRNDRSDKKERI